jgi:GDP-L-fucose synthase
MILEKNTKIYIAGHNGMTGSALVRLFKNNRFDNLILADRTQLNLLNQQDTQRFFNYNKPEVVIISAAKVGGIKANMDFPAEFIYENLTIQNNIIHSAYLSGAKKIVFLGSSCIYPRMSQQPMKEEYLLTGTLEPTNEAYAIAKIAGIKMAEYYHKQYGIEVLCVMPCNLYGTNDNFDVENSHVLSAMVRRFVSAVENDLEKVEVWGTGIAKREFMHVDDFASAIYYLLENYNSYEIVNIGWGKEISIKELAETVAEKAGFKGEIIWDSTKPDGMPLKKMDVTKLFSLGFTPKITLAQGIEQTITEFKALKEKGLIK